MKKFLFFLFILAIICTSIGSTNAQSYLPDSCGFTETALIATWSNNRGLLGAMSCFEIPPPLEPRPKLWYPKNEKIGHIHLGGFWVGAIIGPDTLVSTAWQDAYSNFEMAPDTGISGTQNKKSNNPLDPAYDPSAIAETEYICSYNDSDTILLHPALPIDSTDNRPHIPLDIRICQHTFAFGGVSDSTYWKFVVWDLKVKNIGSNFLQDIYFGILCDGDVGNRSGYFRDDLTGFIDSVTSPLGNPVQNIAWWADNDGDPNSSTGYFDTLSSKSIACFKFLKTPTQNYTVSYNWWTSQYEPEIKSWGPMKQDDFNANGYLPDSLLGMPKGDKAKYKLMSSGEIDYNQSLTNLNHTAEGWLPKPDSSLNIANGFDQRFLFSIGKWDLPSGESLHIAFAIIMGDNFHGIDSIPYPFDMNYPESAYFDITNLLYNADVVQKLYDTLISKVTKVEGEPSLLPVQFDLKQNYPNPFNTSTSIPFSLKVQGSISKEPTHTSLNIYNILGQKVRTLLDEKMFPGDHRVIWDGKDDKGNEISSGIYFYQLKVGDYKETRKMTLLR